MTDEDLLFAIKRGEAPARGEDYAEFIALSAYLGYCGARAESLGEGELHAWRARRVERRSEERAAAPERARPSISARYAASLRSRLEAARELRRQAFEDLRLERMSLNEEINETQLLPINLLAASDGPRYSLQTVGFGNSYLSLVKDEWDIKIERDDRRTIGFVEVAIRSPAGETRYYSISSGKTVENIRPADFAASGIDFPIRESTIWINDYE